MKKLLSLVMFLALAGSALAEQAKVGSAGAQFLKIGVGPKYQAMGEASVATATDIYAAYWNPAGLVEVENWEVSFTSVNWLLDVDLNYVALARYFDDVGTFAVSATVLSMEDQEITTVMEQDGTGKTYSASSYAIGLSFARQLTYRFAFGATVKYVGEQIGEVDSRGYALDFGTLLYTGLRSLRIGMSISNMGPDLEFSGNALKVGYDDQSGQGSNMPVDAELSTNPYNLPLVFRVGLAYDIEFAPKSMVTVSTEFKHPNDNDQQASIGAEYGYDDRFFLRGGYKINYEEETFALGGGLSAPVGDFTRILVDYSWQDFGRLESAQRFSIGFTF